MRVTSYEAAKRESCMMSSGRLSGEGRRLWVDEGRKVMRVEGEAVMAMIREGERRETVDEESV